MKKKSKTTPDSSGAPTLIGADSSFEGTYKGNESLCIEGKFTGTIEGADNVYVHKGARVSADIHAKNVMVHGEVNGNIFSKEEINIGPTGQVNGDVESPSLTVSTGGYLNGQCRMSEEEEKTNESGPQGRFSPWKKEAPQSAQHEEGPVHLDTVQDSSEEDAEERSVGL
ncbi:MAG: polymer-forming cytoskeletal protein [Desulfohalobiaceae bacterium]|nr:polymer-forming cytoskeletal protein [Desulfohalobiaceae bacterium]